MSWRQLPALAPVRSLSRNLSTPEYYHASIGSSSVTLDPPRYQCFFIHGRGRLDPAAWQRALHAAAAVHPGARLRLSGYLWWSRWHSNGKLPQLRVVHDCDWDLRSHAGTEFIDAVPLVLRGGPVVECVLAFLRDGSTLVALRSHHAVMDGMGAMLFMQDVFRALRGEPLLGSNAAYSDVDLMLSVGARHSTSRHLPTQWLTGAPADAPPGDEWRRITLGAPGSQLLPRLAVALAEFAHRYSDRPALFAIPVNLRRHVLDLLAVTNFSNMLMVPMYPGDGTDQFSERLKTMLAARMETYYPRVLDIFRGLPMRWLDRLLSRTAKNYRAKKPLETAVISNVGRHDAALLSGGGFTAECMFLKPLAGSVFCALICVGDSVELTINLPRVLATGGRFDALEQHLRVQLAQPAPADVPSTGTIR